MEFFIAVLVFAASTSITPGPNNIMILSSGVNYGARRSMPHYLGICFGFPVMVALVGIGFGAVFEQLPALYGVIRVAGVLYLLYLAWTIASASPKTLETGEAKPLTFFQAVLFQWVNPKAWVLATGAVAVYTTSGAGIFGQVLAIAVIFFLVAFPCIGAWLFFGLGLKRVLQKPLHQRIFNVAMAVLLVLSIVPMTYDWLQTLAG